ncbi:hypothetical protein AS144_02625 [Francisella endosymbiont of Amblyomma maculatum]|nr:hypothetical protein AS144_02625 [Francisella endosymbiont of Amblyomma maculatum]
MKWLSFVSTNAGASFMTLSKSRLLVKPEVLKSDHKASPRFITMSAASIVSAVFGSDNSSA